MKLKWNHISKSLIVIFLAITTACGIPKQTEIKIENPINQESVANTNNEVAVTENAKESKGDFVSVNGIKMHFLEFGEGQPLILLHGGLTDHTSWSKQIPELSKYYHVYAIDTRGHGQSTDEAEKKFSYKLFAEDISAFMDAKGIKTANIVGHSDGGVTGMELAIHHPDKVNKLVLLGTPYNVSNYPEDTLKMFAKITFEEVKTKLLGNEGVQAIIDQYGSEEKAKNFLHKLINELWATEPNFKLEDLKAIKSPTLILHGEKEEFFGLEASQQIAKSISNQTEAVVVPNATHGLMFDNPNFVNKKIIQFCN